MRDQKPAPCEPTTIRSAAHSRALLTMTRAGEPIASSVVKSEMDCENVVLICDLACCRIFFACWFNACSISFGYSGDVVNGSGPIGDGSSVTEINLILVCLGSAIMFRQASIAALLKADPSVAIKIFINFPCLTIKLCLALFRNDRFEVSLAAKSGFN